GYDQWCLMESIGRDLLSEKLQNRLQELRRKFIGQSIAEPHQMEAHRVPSPIERERASHMSNAHWLRAIERYDGNSVRRGIGFPFESGGAEQLASELQHFSKEQPARFVQLLEQIPDAANGVYISRLLWGLSDAPDLDVEIAQRAIRNAQSRPERPY